MTLNWRYQGRPEGSYSIFASEAGDRTVGYMVLAKREILGRDAGVVMDIWVDDKHGEAARFLLSSAVELFSSLDVRVINCMYKGGRSVSSALRRLGFLRLPQKFLSSQLNLNLKVYDSLGGLLRDDMGDWLFTWSDTDLL
jgi:hypothetical protein